MTSNRHDFSTATKTDLARRAGHRCSLPNCRALTIGPTDSASGSVSVGVACHINAAASGGPRYDPGQTAAQRASVDNGIWCCATCSRLIDGDNSTFTAKKLRSIRAEHEALTQSEVGKPRTAAVTEVCGEHYASGDGVVTALDIRATAIIRPGTISRASGTGRVTATRIGGKNDEE